MPPMARPNGVGSLKRADFHSCHSPRLFQLLLFLLLLILQQASTLGRYNEETNSNYRGLSLHYVTTYMNGKMLVHFDAETETLKCVPKTLCDVNLEIQTIFENGDRRSDFKFKGLDFLRKKNYQVNGGGWEAVLDTQFVKFPNAEHGLLFIKTEMSGDQGTYCIYHREKMTEFMPTRVGSKQNACWDILKDTHVIFEGNAAYIHAQSSANQEIKANGIVLFNGLKVATIKKLETSVESTFLLFSESNVITRLVPSAGVENETSSGFFHKYINDESENLLVWFKSHSGTTFYATMGETPLLLTGFVEIDAESLDKYGYYWNGRIISLKELTEIVTCSEKKETVEHKNEKLFGGETASVYTFSKGTCMVEFMDLMLFRNTSEQVAFYKNAFPLPSSSYYLIHLSALDLPSSLTESDILHFTDGKSTHGFPLSYIAGSNIESILRFEIFFAEQKIILVVVPKQLIFVFSEKNTFDKKTLEKFPLRSNIHLILPFPEKVNQMQHFESGTSDPITCEIFPAFTEYMKLLKKAKFQ